ncbi:flagellar FliJ protein [Aeromonas sp. RU39B]|jgi:flagellar FliJ protein|uniref:flagellar export protein FliJ n=1 Tax=Aeromonas sp. RU39B TaxID=1907416 RepID=UPI000956A7F7|nr:flagellar export protein FliJ [Aeromonas sp. RU39B]SIR16510.1 flagellar FliJ protein [Aeromonas sp. RU39B]
MMARFLELQLEHLAALGEQRIALQQRLATEQQRERQLAELLKNLGMTLDLRQGLVRDNYYQMQRNLERLLMQQKDKVVVAGQELAQMDATWRAQLGKVKGLELLQKQRAQAEQVRQNRQEQRILDEFNTVSYSRD